MTMKGPVKLDVFDVLSLTMTLVATDHLKKRILRDRFNSTIFEKGRGREIFLVGGYVRDILMGLVSSDRDFIVRGNLHSFVREVGDIIGGTVIQFKKGNLIRIVSKEGITFDFSGTTGTLRADLSQRDFTINAIAWSPHRGIVDYSHGLEDIKNKRIRALSKKNMIADPLRILRAYRFAAELNGFIEYRTREIIKTLRDKIKEVSPERITSELFDLLNSRDSSRYLRMSLNDGLLTEILPFPFKKLEKNIREIYKLERMTLKDHFLKIKVLLDQLFSQNLTHKGLLCLILLIKDDNHFSEIPNLRFSKRIIRHTELVDRGMKLCGNRRRIPSDILFDIFVESKEASGDVLLIKNRFDLNCEYRRFQKIWRNGLLSAEEIIHISEINSGSGIGEIIEKLKRAQFVGKIQTKRAAIDFIKQAISY